MMTLFRLRPGEHYKKFFLPYLLIAPGLFFILAFTVYPLFQIIRMSLNASTEDMSYPFHPWTTTFEHYQAIFNDPVYVDSIFTTIKFMIYTTLPTVLISFVLAIWLSRGVRYLKTFHQMSYVYPMILPAVSVASIWLFIYTPHYGLFAHITDILGMNDPTMLRRPETALKALVIMEIWRQVGYFTLFFIAGLSAIPQEVEEAAALDGAGRLKTLWYIQLPLMWPTWIFVMTVALLHGLQTVDPIFIMTQGGPSNATNLMLYQMYQTAFFYNDPAKSSAFATIFLLMTSFIAIFQVYGLDRLWRSDEGSHANR